ncbi:hypothetical protein [Streptomyces sp. NBC_01244]|uniref:hypothetical protein n=1 Tax=Streptomyces sp. NBC_01244 TaxID=2903797 RepID=UPI002E1153CA|nr:hypothetical protein OG247_00395 [Streptomyces sp. NBC_01244]
MFEESDVPFRIRAAVYVGAAAAVLLSAAAASPAAPHPPATPGDGLVVMSDEAYAAEFGAGSARSEG